jgi:methyl-accepting chemotaxis protein
MFSNLSIRLRLLSSFSVVLLFLLLVGTIDYYALRKNFFLYAHIAETNLPNSRYLSQMMVAEKDMVIATTAVLTNGGIKSELQSQLESFDQAVKDYEVAAKAYESSSFAPGEEELWVAVKKSWKPLVEVSEHLMTLSKSGKKEDLTVIEKLFANEYPSLRKTFRQRLDKVMNFQLTEAEMWSAWAKKTARVSQWVALAGLCLGTLVACVLGIVLSRSLSRRLRRIAQQLSSGAEEVAAAARDISTSSEELSGAAAEQAASLQQTSASIEQMNSMIAKTADNAKNSSDVSQSTHEIVRNGQAAVSQVVEAIREIDHSNSEITTQIAESNLEIGEIVKVISEIGEKTKVINDIVFQTKLLSFNASVEAARAGEHGKGFAVVAQEVGNLAQMSGNAAKEISEMLTESIHKVEAIVENTKSRVNTLVDSNKKKVETGTQVAAHCETAFLEIVKKVEEVSLRVHEISVATQEQANGAAEIARVIMQLDQVTQQNTSVSQATSSAAHELSSQAEVLASVVSSLVMTVEGANNSAAALTDSERLSASVGRKMKSEEDSQDRPRNMAA